VTHLPRGRRGSTGHSTPEPSTTTPKSGVLVAEVITGGPAEKVGMHTGDVITGVDGQPVTAAHDVQKIVWLRGIGETLRVEILRNGQKKVLALVTERMPTKNQPRE